MTVLGTVSTVVVLRAWMSGFWTSIVLVSEAGLEVPSPAGRGACRVIWILPCGAEGVLWTVTLVLVPSLGWVTAMVTPGVGDLEVGGVVDLIKEAVCALVPGLWRLTVGCRTIGKAVMDLGPAINADAAAMAPFGRWEANPGF